MSTYRGEGALQRLRRLERRLQRRNRIARVPIPRLKDRSNPLEQFNAVQLKQRFHIYKETAIYITDMIKTDLSTGVKRGTHIPPIIQFLTVQRYFADGSFQMSLGDHIKVSQPTVSNLVKRVATAIAKRKRRFIQFPTFHEAGAVRQGFYNIADRGDGRLKGFPGRKLFYNC